MYIMEMYLFCFVTFLTLARVPEAEGSNCSSYYVLMHKYYDPDWNLVVLDQPKEKIDWNKYSIQSDVPELKRLDHHCVIDLDCKNKVTHCDAKVKPTFMTGTDERIVNPKPILDSTTCSNSDKDSSYLKDISSKTTTKSDKEVSDAGDAVKLTNTDTSTLTKTTTDDNFDEYYESSEMSTSIIAETSTYQETSTNPVVEQSPIASTESTRYDEITDKNKHLTTTDTTVNTEIMNVTLNESQSTTPVLPGKSGKYASKPGEQTSDDTIRSWQAGKIAAGIMGAGALVVVVLVVKKIVIGCLQSGVYHLPT